MSYHGNAVIDMDSHIRQYWDLDRTYKEYMAPEYRETYRRFSEAANALKHRSGERGFSEFLWPALPTRPLGVYESFEVQTSGSKLAGKPPRAIVPLPMQVSESIPLATGTRRFASETWILPVSTSA
jgi:hypothetical protein